MNILTHLKKAFSKRMLFSFALSYIIITVIPFAAMIYSYSIAERNLEEQITHTMDKNMDICLKAVDDKISAYTSIAKTIEKVFDVSDFNSNINPNSYNGISFSKLLSTTSKGYSDMTYFYFPQGNFFISDTYNAYSEEFLERFYSFDDKKEKEDFKKKLSSFSFCRYFTTKDSEGKKYIDFLYSFPMYETSSNIEYSIGFRLSYKSIEEIIRKYLNTEDKNIYFIDSKNNTLFEISNGEKSKLRDYSQYSKLSVSSFNREVQFSKPFAHINWQMIMTTPKKNIAKSISHMRYVTMLVMVLSLFLSAFLAKTFSKSNYKPIKMLLSAISGNNAISDYKKIENVIATFHNQRHTINKLNFDNRHMKYEKFLSALLSGNTDKYQPIDRYMEKYDISFLSDNFAVVIFCIKNANNVFNDTENGDTDIYNDNDTDTAAFIIKNVFEELMAAKHKGYVFEYNCLISAIISISDSNMSTWESDISAALEKTNSFVTENFNFSFTAGTSNIYSGISQLPMAYGEANKIINYSIYMKNTSHISYNEAEMPVKNSELIVDLVKKYINENYTNTNLNVSFIGNHFDMSPYYLSSMLKKSEGISILEYITKVRIEASIVLLNNGATISEAASASGFTSTHTYHRQFNKLKGCTPKQYLKNNH